MSRIGDGQILDLDDLDRLWRRAGLGGFLLGHLTGAGDGLLPAQVDEDLIDLAADLGDGRPDRIGDGVVRHRDDVGNAGDSIGNKEKHHPPRQPAARRGASGFIRSTESSIRP